MATGYVAKLKDGEQTFGDFARGCARAFGSLMEMRESPNDAVIVDVKVIDPRFAENLAAARLTLNGATLRPMAFWESSAAAFAVNLIADRADEAAKREVADAKARAAIARYEQMVERVNAWQPPSSDHEELKTFMLEELDSSIRWDAPFPYETVPAAAIPTKTAKQLRDEAINRAQTAVDDCAALLAKETKKLAERNLWVAQLQASLV